MLSIERSNLHSVLFAAVCIVGITFANCNIAFAENGQVLFDQSIKSDLVSWNPLYSVYLPAGYDTGERKYPVIYLLPGGAGQTHNDWFTRGGAAETLDRMIEAREIPPVVVVSPDPRRTNNLKFNTYYLDDSDGSEKYETMFFEDFVPAVEKRFRVLDDAKFRSTVGLSMGAYGALIYSYRKPGFFAAVAALSPAIRTDEQILSMNQAGWDRRYGQTWGVGLEGEGRLHDRYYADNVFRQIEKSADSPAPAKFYIDTGADDIFFEGSVLLHKMLRKQGKAERTLLSSHIFLVREGGHNWSYWESGLPGALKFVTSAMMNRQGL